MVTTERFLNPRLDSDSLDNLKSNYYHPARLPPGRNTSRGVAKKVVR